MASNPSIEFTRMAQMCLGFEKQPTTNSPSAAYQSVLLGPFDSLIQLLMTVGAVQENLDQNNGATRQTQLIPGPPACSVVHANSGRSARDSCERSSLCATTPDGSNSSATRGDAATSSGPRVRDSPAGSVLHALGSGLHALSNASSVIIAIKSSRASITLRRGCWT